MTNTKTLLTSRSSVAKTDLVGLYLDEIGRLPLLTASEQTDYARNVQEMILLQNARHSLATSKGREPTIIEWATDGGLLPDELKSKIRQGEQAKKKMIEGNLRLVVSIAKKYQNRGIELIDLIQYGSLGLTIAVEKFNPELGYKFSTYAYWWIRQRIMRSLANYSRMIRLPVHLQERLNKIRQKECELTHLLGRKPNLKEIGLGMNLEEETVRDCLEASRSIVSLSLMCGKEKSYELLEILPALPLSPENLTDVEFSRQQVFDLLSLLKHQHKEILCLRFGLHDDKARTRTEIAAIFSLSTERIRQIEVKALRKLREITQSCDPGDLDELSSLIQ